MASPIEKYSTIARIVTIANAAATHAVGANNTSPTTTGINTTAVATRFQVIKRGSPRTPERTSHHIERRKSPPRQAKENQSANRPITLRPPVRAFPDRRHLHECHHNAARAFEIPRTTPAAGRD